MPVNDEPRSPAQIALAVLGQLRGQWDGFALNTQIAAAEVLARFGKAIAPRQYSFEPPVKWDAAVDAFLGDLSTRQDMPPAVQSLLAAPRQASPVSGAEGEALRDAVGGFPGPGLPAFPPRSFSQPRQALLAVVRDLAIYWSVLDHEEQDQIDAAQTRLNGVIRGSASTEAQDAAITGFLRSLDELPEAGALLKRTLDEYTRPYARAVDYVRTLGGTYRDAFAKSPLNADAGWNVMQAKEPGAASLPLATPAELLETVVRFQTQVAFPAQVELRAEAVPLVIQLTLQPPEKTPLDAIRELMIDFSEPGQPEEVEVVVHAEGLVEITGDPSRTIRVYSDRNSQPAVFLFRPEALGRHKLTVDFYHKNRIAGSTSLEVEVVAEVQQAGRAKATGSVAGLPQADLQPPSLELRVITGSDKRTLTYILHSAHPGIGYHWKAAGSKTLDTEPQAFFRSTFDTLSRMARSPERSPEEDQAYRRKLDSIGQNLYDQLFSPELKQEYRDKIRRLRDNNVISSVLITSDEPWVPWELVKPFEYNHETGETILDDDFLCQQFRLSRWLVGRGLPATLRIQTAQLVSYADNLEHVKRESDYFRQLGQITSIQVVPAIETPDDIIKALVEARAQLYHFACHGNFNTENPDESVLRLKGGSFSPSDLASRQAAGVTRSAPLVFVNACHAGRAGFSLTGMGGWAQRFVGAGANAFIGGMWEVNDTLAADFAIRFYDELWKGRPLGEAFYQARESIRKKDQANPTWLAYVLYGDPSSKWTGFK